MLRKYPYFRTGVAQAECATCRPKRKNPEKKIYTERTIELGIMADVFLWESMKVRTVVYHSNYLIHGKTYFTK